jgi:hypothetical protein
LNQEWAARNAATDVSASIVQECQREHLRIAPADSTCAGAKMGLGDHSAAFNTGAGHCKCRGKGLRKCGSNLATTRAAGSRSRGPRLRPAMPAIEKRHLRACLTGNSDWGAGDQGAFWVSSRADQAISWPLHLGRSVPLFRISVSRGTPAQARRSHSSLGHRP